MGIRYSYETTIIHPSRTVMKKILIVLFGVLAFQAHVFAESWEERTARKARWGIEFPDAPACWSPAVVWNNENPWVVGMAITMNMRTSPAVLAYALSMPRAIAKAMMRKKGRRKRS